MAVEFGTEFDLDNLPLIDQNGNVVDAEGNIMETSEDEDEGPPGLVGAPEDDDEGGPPGLVDAAEVVQSEFLWCGGWGAPPQRQSCRPFAPFSIPHFILKPLKFIPFT